MRYSKDPFWMSAKFSSQCGNLFCTHRIQKGEEIFYYPLTRKAYCYHCGQDHASQFKAALFDEVMNVCL